jgi:hypothetical protein
MTTSEDVINALNRDAPIYWGVAAIAARLGRTPRQVYHMLSKGRLKGAIKIGWLWVMTERSIQRNLSSLSQA